MAVRVGFQHGPTTTPAVRQPARQPNDQTAPRPGEEAQFLRQAAIRKRRRARRVRRAVGLTAWLGGSAFLTLFVVGGLAALH